MNFLKSLIIICTYCSLNLSAAEVSWEILKSLGIDAKTKNPIISADLKKAIAGEVSIKGFMMPLDYESKEITEFLFMPYVPSCMHVPPPPANQLILVKMKKGSKIKPTFLPVEVTGKLNVEANPDLESSYKFDGISVKELKDFTPPSPAGAHP